MKKIIKNITKTRFFHMYIFALIVLSIIIVSTFISIKYNVEGETNMPFDISKISVISSSEGIDAKTTEENTWVYNVNQINDIYVYIEKNEYYEGIETIKNIEIDNFEIEAKNNENVNIYKPNNTENVKIFSSSEENKVEELIFTGGLEDSSYQELEISNQGGMIAFRCTNNNIAQLISNEQELNHLELLKKVEITDEDLELVLTFDLKITIDKGITYKTTIELELPVGNVIEEGTTSSENVINQNIIFKREN